MDINTIPKRIDKSKNIIVSDGLVIQQDDMIHTLNVTGAEIFELCDGERDVQNIVDEMASRYHDGVTDTLIIDYINQLHESILVELIR